LAGKISQGDKMMNTIGEKISGYTSLIPQQKIEFLSDIAELFHAMSLDRLPDRPSFHDDDFYDCMANPIGNSEFLRVVDFLAGVVANSQAEPACRSVAAFALGKSSSLAALNRIVLTIQNVKMPADVLRQCAFAYDSLCQLPGSEDLIPSSISSDILSVGLPWDDKHNRILVDQI
jgi:hypothetical protein